MNTCWSSVPNYPTNRQIKCGNRCCINSSSNNHKQENSRRATSISKSTNPKLTLTKTQSLTFTNLKRLVFGFLQKETSSSKVEESRATLDPKKIYHDTFLSFHQMFTDKHLNDVRKVDHSLSGHFNSGVSHADQKGLCSYIFDMWLVRNIIAISFFWPNWKSTGSAWPITPWSHGLCIAHMGPPYSSRGILASVDGSLMLMWNTSITSSVVQLLCSKLLEVTLMDSPR